MVAIAVAVDDLKKLQIDRCDSRANIHMYYICLDILRVERLGFWEGCGQH